MRYVSRKERWIRKEVKRRVPEGQRSGGTKIKLKRAAGTRIQQIDECGGISYRRLPRSRRLWFVSIKKGIRWLLWKYAKGTVALSSRVGALSVLFSKNNKGKYIYTKRTGCEVSARKARYQDARNRECRVDNGP